MPPEACGDCPPCLLLLTVSGQIVLDQNLPYRGVPLNKSQLLCSIQVCPLVYCANHQKKPLGASGNSSVNKVLADT